MAFEDIFERIRSRLLGETESENAVPKFPKGEIIRERIIFEGQVQMVGFRYEMQYTAQKLGMTGKAINLDDGSVLVELQGTKEKIEYCINYVNSVKRFKIEKMTKSSMDVIEDDKSFVTGYESM